MPDTSDIVSGYARALLNVAQAEGALDRVEDELFRLARILEGNAELHERLSDPSLPVQARLEIVTELLAGRVHPQTTGAVLYLVQTGRGRQIVEVADRLVRLAAESRARTFAEVRTAVELSGRQRRRLERALSDATGQDVELRVIVDENVVGGVVARIGDTVIDGSVSRRLADMRARLAGA